MIKLPPDVGVDTITLLQRSAPLLILTVTLPRVFGNVITSQEKDNQPNQGDEMHVIAISQADKDTGLCWTAISLNGRYLGGTFQNDDAINDIINNFYSYICC